MFEKIAKILQQDCQIDKVDRLIVGVSGGADSLCLLHGLYQQGFQVIAAHFNHKLRSTADNEANIVERFAKNLGISFLSGEQDVQSFAHENSISIEEAARQLRYRFLFTQACKENANAVLVAHNADDQVETILMHLLRGSGLAGLIGMDYRKLPNPWSNKIPLVRPLLTTRRAEINQYLIKNEILPAEDLSNQDTTYTRNRIRHLLIPMLEEYNPRLFDDLIRLHSILREDYLVLQNLVDSAWKNCIVDQGKGYLTFKRSGFIELQVAIQRNFLRNAIEYHLPGLIDVDFNCIERGRMFLIENRSSGRVNLLSGLWLICEGDNFFLVFNQADLPGYHFPKLSPDLIVPIEVPSKITLDDGWVLWIMLNQRNDFELAQTKMEADLYHAWLDLESLPQPLILRCRRPGDRIIPLGMGGHSMKISDLMINLKVPERARKTWPLVCSGEEVIWVPGYRLSESGRVKENSTSIAHLALLRGSSTELL
jgi:tRNA(Ile)-lysidine synthase